ncbi:NAD-dependent epimerase [Vibrio sp. 10N.286.49.B3]|nr:NAD-dependent epimerase [Vibrio sp. 10N.286.49.B3]
MKRADQIKKVLQNSSADVSKLSFVELDLTSDKGWDNATEGCDYLLHVASPYSVANPKNADDMIKPAVEGSLRALRAAKKAGIKRVVLTSSTLTMMATMKSGTFGPNDWADTNSKDISTYAKSKTLAEKAAWQFMDEQNDDSMELVSISPGGVFGPPLGSDITGQSLTMIDKMLKGKVPMIANIAMPMVDVRDVAKIHVQAMTHPDAKNQRIIASHSEPNRILEIAKTLKNEGYQGPSVRTAPDLLLRVISLFDDEAKGMVGLLGKTVHADNSKTVDMFGWSPRPFTQSVLDSAKAIKAIQKKS